MADDIVTRLREACRTSMFDWSHWPTPHESLVKQAADEIERLEADRDRWRSLANALTRDLAFRTDETAANFIVEQMVSRILREQEARRD